MGLFRTSHSRGLEVRSKGDVSECSSSELANATMNLTLQGSQSSDVPADSWRLQHWQLLSQKERENKQQAPWCHFYRHFSDSNYVFIQGTQSKRFRANGFLAVGRGCSFQIHYSIDEHNAKVSSIKGWLITTCLLPITPITLEVMGPMIVQHGANKIINIHCLMFSDRNTEKAEVPWNKHHSWIKWAQSQTLSSRGHCRGLHYVNYVY